MNFHTLMHFVFFLVKCALLARFWSVDKEAHGVFGYTFCVESGQKQSLGSFSANLFCQEFRSTTILNSDAKL